MPFESKIAVEATGNWWWFVEKVRELGHEVYLSYAMQTKAIASARLKSDKVDALMLARLLKVDLLPMVWLPGERERYVRKLLSHRARLGRARTTVINELHAVYAKRNVELIGRVRLRAHPIPLRVKELSGYAPGLLKSSGIMCVNGGPLREGMKAPTILHGLSHIDQATISRDLSSSNFHCPGSSFEFFIKPFNWISRA